MDRIVPAPECCSPASLLTYNLLSPRSLRFSSPQLNSRSLSATNPVRSSLTFLLYRLCLFPFSSRSEMLSFMGMKKRRTGEAETGSVEKRSRSSEEKDEKVAEGDITTTSDLASIDASEADEALLLVGTARTQEFSEEYNAKLRRKLVSCRAWNYLFAKLNDIMALGFCYSSDLRGSVLLTIPVSYANELCYLFWFNLPMHIGIRLRSTMPVSWVSRSQVKYVILIDSKSYFQLY